MKLKTAFDIAERKRSQKRRQLNKASSSSNPKREDAGIAFARSQQQLVTSNAGGTPLSELPPQPRRRRYLGK